MSTKAYPDRSATEALLDVTGDFHTEGYDLKGALVDVQFTTRLAPRSLMALPVDFIGRYLAFERCQCRQCQSCAAQRLRADLVIDAFNVIVAERQRDPSLSWCLSWRKTQREAAQRRKAVLIVIRSDAA